MIKKSKIQHALTASLAGLAAAGITLVGTSMAWAASTVTDTFDSDISGWSVGNGTATLSWNATNGNPGGCLQVVATDDINGTESDPQWALPAPINSAEYLNVQFDIYVDPASGTSSGSATYGYVQAVLRNAGFSWEGFGWTAMDASFSTGWQHMTMTVPSPYDTMAYLLIQITPNGGDFTSPATYYIDNVTITPLPDPWLVIDFTDNSLAGTDWDPTVTCPYYNPITQTTTNIPGAGSYKNTYTANSTWGDWDQINTPGNIDLTRFETIGFDLFLDGPTGGTLLGGMQFQAFEQNPVTYAWANQLISDINFTASMVGKWTHFDFPASASGISNCPALAFGSTPGSDGGGNPVTYHIANIELWTPVAIPKFATLTPNALVGGVHATVDGAGDQWDRNQLCIPSGDNVVNYFWTQQEPATYSMTISNFPSPATAPGLEGHIYIVNEDTTTAGNETSGSPDWNCGDLVIMRVQNGNNGGVISTFEWKTNLPAANPPNVTQFTYPNLTSANGTWTLNFSSDYAGTIVAPDGTVNNFTLPNFSQDPNYNNNFYPGTSFMNWGIFKNDGANSGINNGDGFVITQVLVTNNVQGVMFNDNFPGPGLTANYAWRTSDSTYVAWIPSGIAYWLQWTLPDTGYSVQSASSVSGPWADAGVTYTQFDSTGTNRLGAVPAASLPAGNAAFFRLTNPNP